MKKIVRPQDCRACNNGKGDGLCAYHNNKLNRQIEKGKKQK